MFLLMTRFALFFAVFALICGGTACAASTTSLPTAPASGAATKTAPVSKPAAVNAPTPVGPQISAENPYTVKGVKVDVNADTSVKARDKAFMKGGRDGFVAIARRLTADDTYDGAAVDDAALSKMIRSFEVETERASGTRYVATLTFHYKPQEVASVLSHAGKTINEDPYDRSHASGAGTETPAATPLSRVVLLPILRMPDRNVLWEEKTPWHKAWENVFSDHPRGDVVLTEGSMDDIGTLSTAEALSGMRPALTRIMNRYQAQGVVVAALMAPQVNINPAESTSIQIARFDAQGQMMGTATLSLAGNPQRRQMEWLQSGAAAALGAMEEISLKAVAQQVPAPTPAGGIPSGYAGVVTRVLVNVPFATMEDWAARRAMLEQIQGVTNLEVLRMNRSRAMIQFDFLGEQPSLDTALAQRGQKIMPSPENDGSYLMMPTAQPQMAPMQPHMVPTQQPVYYPQPSGTVTVPMQGEEQGEE